MKLHIEPKVALYDQKKDICVSELPSFGKVRINASFCLPWAKDVLFESSGWFTSDKDGRVDLAQQKPDSGSYDFIDSMGLIESAQSQDPKVMEKIAKNISVNESMFITIVVECEQERASEKLERLFKTAEIKSQRITDEFVGELFYSELPDRKTIVWLAGSGGGLGINSPVCAPLASHGFNVLSVPFFGEKGLPAQLSRIPLEYFEKVFHWLSNNPITAGKDIQILGMSKGAELALVLASRNGLIKKVAVWAPHAYSFQGIAYKDESSWTYAERDLPFIRLKNRWVLGNVLHSFIKNEPFEFASVYKKGVSVAKNKEAARIRVEEAQTDLLLFTSKNCGMWNTYDGSVKIMETLQKCGYPHSYHLVVYEDAGEPYMVPYVLPAGMNSVKMAPRMVLSMGGTLEGNAYARVDAWEKAIAFLS